MDDIESIILTNVEVQQNGIIRNSKGYLIARLVDNIDFYGEHVFGIKKDEHKKSPEEEFADAIKDSPEKIIKFCKKEIAEYEKLIKILEKK